jgi:transcriptional regulator with XRE-family HTH domain
MLSLPTTQQSWPGSTIPAAQLPPLLSVVGWNGCRYVVYCRASRRPCPGKTDPRTGKMSGKILDSFVVHRLYVERLRWCAIIASNATRASWACSVGRRRGSGRGTMSTSRILSFGALLKHHRSRAGLTQEALAQRAGISDRAVRSIERGAQRTSHVQTVRLLADALGLSGQDRTIFESAARGQRTSPFGFVSAEPPFASGGPPLVGRVCELNVLERHLRGEGPLVLLLAGEPGIGKSRLLHEAATRAASCGWKVLHGGCRQRDGRDPYAPMVEALEHHIHRKPPAKLRAELRGCAWLVCLLPELADRTSAPPPPLPLTPEQERRLMYGAVARFLSNVAGPAGTLLVLDDLQWAGHDALDLLAALVRSSSQGRLCVVGAYRDTEVQPRDPFSAMLADLVPTGLVTHHTLAPLAPEEARRLLERLLEGVEGAGSALRERLLRRTGGVPSFIVSCVRGLRLHGREGGAEDVIPWDVVHGLRQRVEVLPEAAREVLRALVVVGDGAPRALLVAVVARPEDEVLAGLAAACRARLLVQAEADACRFAHDVIREVVEADLGAGWRAVLQRRAAEALGAQAGGTAPRVAGQPRRPRRRTREGGAVPRPDGRLCPRPGSARCRAGLTS